MSLYPHRNPKQNRLLAALPDSDFGRLLPDLEPLAMPLGWHVFETPAPSYVYFPTTALVSMLHVMESNAPAEITFAGNESVVGISLFMDDESGLRQGVVHTAGEGYRIKADVLKTEFALGTGFQQMALRYAKSVRARLVLTAECHRQHLPLQQLSRWLLLCSDSLACTELKMSPELISNMLRRDGVAQAVELLEIFGVVHYSRGQITILDRSQLEQHACDCYGAVKSELSALFPERAAVAEAAVRGATDS